MLQSIETGKHRLTHFGKCKHVPTAQAELALMRSRLRKPSFSL